MGNAHIGSGITFDGRWVTRDLPSGDQVRATITQDPYTEEPERGKGMWCEGVYLYTDQAGLISDDHYGIRTVLDRIGYSYPTDETTVVYGDPYAESITRDGEAKCSPEVFVRRYLRAFYDVQWVGYVEHRGYSQSDWAGYWLIVDGADTDDPQGLALAYWNEWDAWANGDVYSVNVQRRSLLDAMNADGPDDGWTDADYYDCGDAYGDDGTQYALATALFQHGDNIDNLAQVMPKPYRFPAEVFEGVY